MPFPFENLHVYQKSLDWVEAVDDLAAGLRGKISASMQDQLCRAALSVSLNIAEGNGRWHKAEKRQFFWIARGSAFECLPVIQILRSRNLIAEERYKSLYADLDALAKMLTNLIKSVESLNQGERTKEPGTSEPTIVT